jgi:pimeloyl-ACP methyl ester carboxylesterase
MGEVNNQKKHFVLIHGSVAGAWIWYKVKPRLEEAGHRVTALDMAASGVNTKTIEEVRTFDLYNEPLMEFMAKLPENEKVVLVGHSLGGLNLAFAMEKFPEKVSLAIFLTAILPDTVHQPSYMLEKVPFFFLLLLLLRPLFPFLIKMVMHENGLIYSVWFLYSSKCYE